jgi:hypothetical protein
MRKFWPILGPSSDFCWDLQGCWRPVPSRLQECSYPLDRSRLRKLKLKPALKHKRVSGLNPRAEQLGPARTSNKPPLLARDKSRGKPHSLKHPLNLPLAVANRPCRVALFNSLSRHQCIRRADKARSLGLVCHLLGPQSSAPRSAPKPVPKGFLRLRLSLVLAFPPTKRVIKLH